jgi:uncharacterized protein YjiS (DUF1127 family)
MKTAAASATRSVLESTTQPILGVVKSTYPKLDVSRLAVNDADYSGAAELDVWARRTFAANGFGDAAVEVSAVGAARDAMELRTAAHLQRSAAFWAICFSIGEAIAEALHGVARRWRQKRELRRTYEALSGLDARTLKDIGFGDHEASSIAAELAGRAERTRIQALRSLRELAI